jgi:hypothetical protein
MPTAAGRSAVTTWVENPHGGRDRGAVPLARAWVEVLVRPRRFFRTGIAPGDQAPGLTFAIVNAFAYVLLWLAFAPGSTPAFARGSLPGSVLFVAVVALIVAPTILHLTAALQTVALIASVRDRSGVSQTVQVVAYACAPCALAALPSPALRVVCALYGAGLLVLGLAIVHETTPGRAALAAAVPAVLLFGYVFGAVPAAETILAADSIEEVVWRGSVGDVFQ